MNIEIYALCHQEAPLIPYFMRHYNQYGQVHLFESDSTDGSPELAKSLGAVIIPLPTGNQVRDDIFTAMKNSCWKQSRADWVIVCDTDEFIYHPNLKKYLSTLDDTAIIPESYEMFSDVFPTTKGQIYDEVNMGIHHTLETNCKLCLFRPMEITAMNYGVGCHSAQPTGNVKINKKSEVIYMHMRHLSVDYVVNRNAYYRSRRSAINKERGWGFHVECSRSDVESWFAVNKPNLVKVPIR